MIPDLRMAVARVPGAVEAPLPTYGTEGASGMDLHAAILASVTIRPGGRARIPTGLAFAIPHHFEGQIRPRSGRAYQEGVTVLNAPGTIDADYRGEVQVLLINLGENDVQIEPLDRIAQLVIVPVAYAELRLVQGLTPTLRGGGGYGSTGK